MSASYHATEILNAISNNQSAELKRRLVLAARDCESAGGLSSFEQEKLSVLEACVEALNSEGESLNCLGATLQMLQHLAEPEERYPLSASRNPSISSNRLFPSLTI